MLTIWGATLQLEINTLLGSRRAPRGTDTKVSSAKGHRLPNGVRTNVFFAEVPYIPIIMPKLCHNYVTIMVYCGTSAKTRLSRPRLEAREKGHFCASKLPDQKASTQETPDQGRNNKPRLRTIADCDFLLCLPDLRQATRSRTNGVNTNGAAAKVNILFRFGDKGTPWHVWEDKLMLTGVPKKSVKKHDICSDPSSADPICPSPSNT